MTQVSAARKVVNYVKTLDAETAVSLLKGAVTARNVLFLS